MLWPESEDKYTTSMLRIQDGLNEPASTLQRTTQEKHGKHGKTSFVHFIERFFQILLPLWLYTSKLVTGVQCRCMMFQVEFAASQRQVKYMWRDFKVTFDIF